jgi:hypothetical protein
MKLIEIKTLMYELLLEEINKDQLISTAKSIHKRESDLKKWVEETDPTPNQGFSVWLLRGLKKQWIRMEDGQRAKQTLERFIQLRRVNKIEDIMKYPHINDLENAIERLSGVGAKRQGFSGVNPETLPGVEKFEEKRGITFYKVRNVSSLEQMGEGTKWCTRKSYGNGHSMAKSYLDKYGHLIVGYKDGKPYIQFNPDYSQIMDVNDTHFKPTDSEELKILPRPKVPTEYNLTLGGNEPRDVVGMRNWSKLTGGPLDLPGINPEFWKEFEPKLAKSILKANSYGGILNTMRGWQKMFSITKQRTPEVEKAIINKDWSKVRMRYFGGGGPMKHIPGMWEIVEYVKTVIKGNWPEFENKIQYDKFNTIYYHIEANLDPVNVKDPMIKDFITFGNKIKRDDPSIKTEEFKNQLKSFVWSNKYDISKARLGKLLTKHILRPYLIKINKKYTPYSRASTLPSMINFL